MFLGIGLIRFRLITLFQVCHSHAQCIQNHIHRKAKFLQEGEDCPQHS